MGRRRTASVPDLSPAALAAAIESNVVARCAYLGRWSRVEVHDDPDRLWTICDVHSTLFNQIARARFPAGDPQAADAVAAALAPFAARKLAGHWWIGPGDQPHDLGTRLDARGLYPSSLPGMAADLRALDLDAPAPPGLTILRADDQPALDLWVQVIATAWQLPATFVPLYAESCAALALGSNARWHLYVALLHGTPVGTSSVFYGAGAAGMYHVGVAPPARRQGIGTALTLAPLRDAAQRGERLAVLFASPMATSLYQRLGFREYCRIGQRAFGVPAQEHVRRLQADLARLGFDPGPADGLYGPQTIAAVTRFQTSRGLHVDGLSSPQTRRALDEALAALAAANT